MMRAIHVLCLAVFLAPIWTANVASPDTLMNTKEAFGNESLPVNVPTLEQDEALSHHSVQNRFFIAAFSIGLLLVFFFLSARFKNEFKTCKIFCCNPTQKIRNMQEGFVVFTADPFNLASVYTRIYASPSASTVSSTVSSDDKVTEIIIEEDLNMIV